MADSIGEFSLAFTGGEQEKTDSGGIRVISHWEGTATGFGTVFGTLTVDLSFDKIDATSGACSWVALAYLPDGGRAGGFSEGTWTQHEGRNAWSLTLTGEASTGQKIRSEGEIDLAARTYSGKMYDAS